MHMLLCIKNILLDVGNMDRGWMRELKISEKHVDGVATFMRFLREHFGHDINICC